jgi:hypothetical protein
MVFFVRRQLANSTGIASTVNRISENYLALAMPTGFFQESQRKSEKWFCAKPKPREIFTRTA